MSLQTRQEQLAKEIIYFVREHNYSENLAFILYEFKLRTQFKDDLIKYFDAQIASLDKFTPSTIAILKSKLIEMKNELCNQVDGG